MAVIKYKKPDGTYEIIPVACEGGGSGATNLENDTETGSLKQIVEPGKENTSGPNKDEAYGAKSKYSTVLGATSVAEGKRSFAHGTQNAARGGSSHAEGDSTETGIDAYGAHSEGYKTKTDAPYSHVEGWGNKVIKEITSSVDDEGISGVWIIKDFANINIPATVTENINFSYVKRSTGEIINGTRMYLENKPAKNISSIENGTYVTLQYNGSYSTVDHEIDFGSTRQYPSAEFLAAVKGAMTRKQPEPTYRLSGTRKFNNAISITKTITENVSFSSNNETFNSFSIVSSINTIAFDNTSVYNGGTFVANYKQFSFLQTVTVSRDFYEFIVANTTVVQPQPPVLDNSNGDISHTEGIGNITLGWASHTEGQGNRNYAHYSSVKGTNNIAGRLKEKSSTHEGHTTTTIYIANGNSIDVGGSGNIVQYSNQTVRGQFNDNKPDTLLEIGNGEDDETRSNAFEVYKDGHAEIGKVGDTDNSLVTKKYVDNKKILHELVYDGIAIKDEEGDTLTFADIKTLIDSPYDYVYINDLTNHCMLNYGAYENDALWFNSRYKIDSANNLVRLIINTQNQIQYDVDEILVQHVINVNATTSAGTYRCQFSFEASASVRFTTTGTVASHLYSKNANLRLPASGTYVSNGVKYIITGISIQVNGNQKELVFEMVKLSDGSDFFISSYGLETVDIIIKQ